jgi:hypothetical protein
MRASEFIFNEGKASRRKQASMNAKRRNANAQQTTAPAAQPTASTGTSAPAVAPTNVGNRPNPYMTPQANVPSELDQEVQPTQAQPVQAQPVQAQPVQATQPTQSASTGTDWNALNKATAPTPAAAQPSAGSSMMSALKSAGKGIANKFSKQGQISARTDKIFMDKFLKDMATAEQTSTGLRGEPFDVKTWVGKYLAQNKWDAGDQQVPLDKAVASNNKKAIATSMAAIGKYNNLGSTINAKAATAQATAAGTGAMGQMAKQLTKPLAGSQGGAGAMGQMASQLTQPAATAQPTAQPAANPFGQMTSQLTKSTATQPRQQAKAEPIKIGKHTLDPNDPTDAKMIAMVQKQGNV